MKDVQRTASKFLLGAAVGLAVGFWQLRSEQRQHVADVAALRAELDAAKAATLADGTTRNGVVQTSAEGVDAAGEAAGVSMEPVRSDAQATGGQVQGVSAVEVRSTAQAGQGLPSSHSRPTKPRPGPAVGPAPGSSGAPAPLPSPPPGPVVEPVCRFCATTEQLELADQFGPTSVPWGRVGFTSKDAKPWSLEVFPRTLRVATVVAVREDGSIRPYTHVDAEVGGQHYTLPSSDSRWTEQRPEARLRWSAKPYLGAGPGIGIGARGAGLLGAAGSVSVASYGQTTAQPQWTFGLMGVGGTSERRAGAFVSPAAWNVGQPLPLFDSLFLAPTWSIDTSGKQSVLLMLAAKL